MLWMKAWCLTLRNKKLPAVNQSIEKSNESINLNKLTHALANNTCKQIT